MGFRETISVKYKLRWVHTTAALIGDFVASKYLVPLRGCGNTACLPHGMAGGPNTASRPQKQQKNGAECVLSVCCNVSWNVWWVSVWFDLFDLFRVVEVCKPCVSADHTCHAAVIHPTLSLIHI